MSRYSKPTKRAYKFLEFIGNLDTEKEFPIKVYHGKDKSEEMTRIQAEKKVWIMQWNNFLDSQGKPTGVIDNSTIERSAYSLETYEDLFERFQDVGEAPMVQVIKGKIIKVVHDPRQPGGMTSADAPKKESNVESENAKG